MILKTPEVKRVVDDYDFVFSSGHVMPVSVDVDLGDSVEFTKYGITINLTAKPSIHDPEKMLPAEDITIFARHLISVQHRKREIVELSPNEKAEWVKTFKETIN